MKTPPPHKFNVLATIWSQSTTTNDLGEPEQAWVPDGTTWIGVKSANSKKRERVEQGAVAYEIEMEILCKKGEIGEGQRVNFDSISGIVQKIDSTDRGFDRITIISYSN